MQRSLLTVQRNTNMGHRYGTHREHLLTRCSAEHFHAAVILKYVPHFFDPPPYRRWSLIPSPEGWSGLRDLLLD